MGECFDFPTPLATGGDAMSLDPAVPPKIEAHAVVWQPYEKGVSRRREIDDSR